MLSLNGTNIEYTMSYRHYIYILLWDLGFYAIAFILLLAVLINLNFLNCPRAVAVIASDYDE